MKNLRKIQVFGGEEGKYFKPKEMKVFGGVRKENIETLKENKGFWKGEEGKY